MSDVKYAIEKYRLKKSLMKGFEMSEDKKKMLHLTAVQTPEGNGVFIMPLDSGTDDAQWGRFRFDLEKDEQTAIVISVAASNELIDYQSMTIEESKRFITTNKQCCQFTNVSDIVMYSLHGRYLYIYLECYSDEIVGLSISNMSVDRIGDVFMGTFPRVYQERDSFFHRYMSVLSSEYTDLEDEIDALPELLNLDTCPAELLPVFGSWLGIDTGDSFLSEEILRTFVKEAYQLNKMKGTRYCLERVCEILLGENGIIVERNQLSEFLDPSTLKEYNDIYGSSNYDVTLLLKVNLSQTKRSQLEYILEQFLPIRCSLHIVELSQFGGLDMHTYLDVNARVFMPSGAALDADGSMDQNLILS